MVHVVAHWDSQDLCVASAASVFLGKIVHSIVPWKKLATIGDVVSPADASVLQHLRESIVWNVLQVYTVISVLFHAMRTPHALRMDAAYTQGSVNVILVSWGKIVQSAPQTTTDQRVILCAST